VEYRLLGALEVRDGERPVLLTAAQQRVILTVLLLSANRPVGPDVLVEALWGERPPATADAILQNRVSQLRKLLGPEALVRDPAGYVLDVAEDALDVRRFERLAAEGRRELAARRPRRAAERLAEALALWRGPALADVAYSSFAQPHVTRLEELRLTALEDWADAELACGRHHAVVAELEARSAEHPLRERTTAQLMLALYRSGRQADALEAHARTRRALADELGLEAGRELKELERAILNHDPALAAPAEAQGRHLPAPPTPLVGREQEIAQVLALLGRPEVRLVTIGGPGGIGKTRLALAAAEELSVDFSAGAVMVDLTPLREPELVLPAVARALEVVEEPGASLQDAVARRLAERPSLIVFDNFEQVVDGAPVVAALLKAADGWKALSTSRVPLRLLGEHELELGPLAEDAAVELLSARVRAVRPELDLETSAPEEARAICRRLDALPLALELAAPRLRTLAPATLLARLEHMLDLLTEGARDLPERQRTLRSTIDWSVQMLDEVERRVLARLAIFAGAWNLDAAEEIAGDDGSLVMVIDALVSHSLIRRVGGADDRFVLLETIREFGLELLEAEGRLGELAERHARRVERLAEEAWQAWLTDGAARADAAAAELDDVRAALRRALDGGEPGWAMRTAGALYPLWRGSAPTEGRVWLEEAMGAVEPEAVVPRSLFALAGLLWPSGEYARADELLSRAGEGARAAGDDALVRRSLAARGGIAFSRGDRHAAATFVEQAAALARDADDELVLYRALNILAGLRYEDEDFPGAGETLREARALARRKGDRVGEAVIVANLVRLALAEEDVPAALAHAHDAVAGVQEGGPPYLRGQAMLALALAQLAAGRTRDARTSFAEALSLEEPPDYAPTGLLGFAAVEADAGRMRHAARLVGAAVATRDRMGLTPDVLDHRIEARLRESLARELGVAWATEEAAGRLLSFPEAVALADA
jgi:predicted ATPase/DNA-binding SARP family transcriptional activator